MNLKEYEIIDTIEKITITDSFIKGSNKIGTGHGEAKLYVGQVTDKRTLSFFEIDEIRGAEINCFVLKKDLISYLNEVRVEYEFPTQDYAKIDIDIWKSRHLKLSTMSEILPFMLKDQDGLKPPRIYLNTVGNSTNYNLIREIALANISYLACLKLQHKLTKEIVYYFRIFADLNFLNLKAEEEKILQTIKNNTQIQPQEKERISNARIGQGKYREKLLSECPFCPITMIGDDRLLIASHIKPWRFSDDFEKTDPKNGFMLTPTIDFLFDRGFISFSNNKEMFLSPWISKNTYKNLGLSDLKTYPMLPVFGREKYLEFHRNNIFKK